MENSDKPLNGILYEGRFYEAENGIDSHEDCGLCDLKDKCKAFRTYDHPDASTDAMCYAMGLHSCHFRFLQSITDKINGKKRGYGPWSCVHCSENGTCTHGEVQYDRCVAYGNSGIGCVFAEKD